MSAVADLRAASPAPHSPPSAASASELLERLRQAIRARDDWLAAGLSTARADTAAGEAVVTDLYALAGRPRPAFEWVPSPAAALSQPGLLEGWPLPAARDWPLAARLASLVSALRGSLEYRIDAACRQAERHGTWTVPWAWKRPPGPADEPAASPEEALLAGAPLDEVLDRAVYFPLRGTLLDAVCAPLRAALPGAGRGVLTWHGQQDAWWAGRFDAWRRAGLVRYQPDDDAGLDLWCALARSAGWWWPAEDRCVMAERPAVLRAEPTPGGRPGLLRLHRDDGPAIGFADGWGRHVLHGTPVPAWVITGPTVEAIHREPNIEVRRTAIERLGWNAYLDRARLTPVAARPDPGNPGASLRLYDLPGAGRPARFLLAVNGSPEPDGRHRQYGLTVPADIDDPVDAAAWTYGLTGAQYACLVRRT